MLYGSIGEIVAGEDVRCNKGDASSGWVNRVIAGDGVIIVGGA